MLLKIELICHSIISLKRTLLLLIVSIRVDVSPADQQYANVTPMSDDDDDQDKDSFFSLFSYADIYFDDELLL